MIDNDIKFDNMEDGALRISAQKRSGPNPFPFSQRPFF